MNSRGLKMPILLTSTVIILGCLMIPLPALPVQEEYPLPFDRGQIYDVYFQGNDSSAFVIRRVKIKRLAKIVDQTYLVVADYVGLQTDKDEGYILYSSIVAILPSNTFNVDRFAPRLHNR